MREEWIYSSSQQMQIRIYTVTGALIKDSSKRRRLEDGTISWNLITEDRMDLAFGLYIYHVDALGA